MIRVAGSDLEDDVARLAQSVSLAARVDPRLLREARLRLHPHMDAGIEADVWFSSLVETRSASGIVFAADALDELRTRLAADPALLDDAWDVTSAAHAGGPVTIGIEEECTYQALRASSTDAVVGRGLEQILAAMLDDEQRAKRLARWVARAAPRLPEHARALPTTWMLKLRASVHFPGLSEDDGDALPAEAGRWLEQVLPTDPPRTWIHVRLMGDVLEVARQGAPGSLPIHVPDSNPVVLEVRAGPDTASVQRVDLRRRPAQVQLRDREAVVEIRTPAGEVHALHRAWSLRERIEGYADFLHEFCLAFHVGALVPEAKSGSMTPLEFGAGVVLEKDVFDVIRHESEWAMGSVRDLFEQREGESWRRWVEALVRARVLPEAALDRLPKAVETYLAVMVTLFEYRLENGGDFEWTASFQRPGTMPLIKLNVPDLVAEIAPREHPTQGEVGLFVTALYSEFVRAFNLVADRLTAALGLVESGGDRTAARDDTLRRLLLHWPPRQTDAHAVKSLGVDMPVGRPVAPYVSRDADLEVDAHLQAKESVLLVGEPFSGMTRSAYQAVARNWPSAPLLVPVDGPALARLAQDELLPPLPEAILWLDELHRFMGNDGLTPDLLAQLRERTGKVIVVATIEAGILEDHRERVDALGLVQVSYGAELSSQEREAAYDLYPEGTEQIEQFGLGRYLAGRTSADESEIGALDVDVVERRVRRVRGLVSERGWLDVATREEVMRAVEDLVAIGDVPSAVQLQRELVAGLQEAFGMEFPELMRARTRLWQLRSELSSDQSAQATASEQSVPEGPPRTEKRAPPPPRGPERPPPRDPDRR